MLYFQRYSQYLSLVCHSPKHGVPRWERAAYAIRRPENLARFKNITTESACSFLCEGGKTKYVWLPLPNEFGNQYVVHLTKGFGKSYQAIVAL